MPKKTRSKLKGVGISPVRRGKRDSGINEDHASCDLSSIPSSGAIFSLAESFDGGIELYEDEWEENKRGGGDESAGFDQQILKRDPGDLKGDMEEAINAVGEKRGRNRLQGLNKLYMCLQHIQDASFILERMDTLSSLLLTCLKKAKSEEEKVATNKALATLFVRLGPDEDNIVHLCFIPLCSFLANIPNNGTLSRAASATALSMCCFMCSTDDLVTEEAMRCLSRILKDFPEDVIEYEDSGKWDFINGLEELMIATMKGWALLATTSTRAMCLDLLPTLLGCLHSPSPDVRNATGESLAMLYELHGATHRESNDDAEEEGEGTVHDDAESNILGINMYDCYWDEFTSEVSRLLNVSTKRINKNVKRTQRSVFSSIQRTIAQGIPPEEVMRIPGGIIEARSRSAILVLHAMRECLGSGFQTQLQVDEVLRDMLDVQKWGDIRGRAEVHEKSGDYSKMRTMERNKQRKGRDHERHSALWAE